MAKIAKKQEMTKRTDYFLGYNNKFFSFLPIESLKVSPYRGK